MYSRCFKVNRYHTLHLIQLAKCKQTFEVGLLRSAVSKSRRRKRKLVSSSKKREIIEFHFVVAFLLPSAFLNGWTDKLWKYVTSDVDGSCTWAHVLIGRCLFWQLPIGQFRVPKPEPGAPNENIVQNHLNIALLNVFWYLNGRYRHIFIP